MSFSCFAKKRTKRRRPRGAELLAHLRAKSRTSSGCAPKRACGRSRKQSRPLGYPRRALTMVPAHLNLDPVWGKSVPAFLHKGKVPQKDGRAARAEPPLSAGPKPDNKFCPLRCSGGWITRDGWILKEGVFLRGSAELSASLSRILWLLSWRDKKVT